MACAALGPAKHSWTWNHSADAFISHPEGPLMPGAGDTLVDRQGQTMHVRLWGESEEAISNSVEQLARIDDAVTVAANLATLADPRILARLQEIGAQHELSLDLWQPHRRGANIEVLDQIPNVRALVIHQSDSPDELTRLRCVERIEHLSLEHNNVLGPTSFDALRRFASLQSLDLGNTKFGDDDVKSLARLSNLRQLDLWATSVSDKGLRSLADLDRLFSVHLNDTKVDGPGLRHLAGKPLMLLALNGTQVGDEDLESLGVMTTMKSVELQKTAIQDVDLATLFPALSLLDVTQTKVGDAFAQKLAAAKQLEELEVAGTELTNQSIPALASLPKLRSLDITDTKIEPDVIESAGLPPGTRIEFHGGSSTVQ